MGTSTTLRFILVADSTQFDAKLKKTAMSLAGVGVVGEKSVGKVTNSVSRLNHILTRAQSVITSVGISLAFIAAVKIFGTLIRSSIDFDAAFTGVRKTVEGTALVLEGLRKEIRQMSTEIPFTTEELSRITQVAGQLGVQAGDLSNFTKTVAQLAVASEDLEFEDAAFALARLTKIMGDDINVAEKMSSSIVALGNKLATTEGEIIEMTLRMGATARVIGLTTPEVIGLAAAMSQLGIRAQAGGTAWSKTFASMKTAVDTNSSALGMFAQVASRAQGVIGEGIKSGKDFAEVFKNEPVKAIALFVSGMTQVIKTGGPAFKVLKNLGLARIRVARGVLSAAAAEGELARAIEISSMAYRQNKAAREEALKFYGSWENRLKVVGNRLTAFVQTQSEVIMPSMVWFLEDVTHALDDYRQAIDRANEGLDKTRTTQEGFWYVLTDVGINAIEGGKTLLHGFNLVLAETLKQMSEEAFGTGSAIAKYWGERVQEMTTRWTEHQKVIDEMIKGYHTIKSDESLIKSWSRTLGVSVEAVTAEIKALTKEGFLNAVLHQEGYIESLRDVDKKLRESGKEFDFLGEDAEKTRKEIEKLEKSWKSLSHPLETLVDKLEEYSRIGVTVNEFAKAHADDILKAAEAERSFSGELSETGDKLVDAAIAFSLYKKEMEDLPLIKLEGRKLFDIKEWNKDWKDFTTTLGNTGNAVDEINASWDINAAALATARYEAEKYGTPLEQTIARLREEADALGEVGVATRDMAAIMKRQFSTILTDLGKNFADIIVKWKGLWQSLKDIASDFARSILRMLFESLFAPIMNGIAAIFSGAKGGFGGGFQAAGGFGGIGGIVKGVGGLLGIGGAATTAATAAGAMGAAGGLGITGLGAGTTIGALPLTGTAGLGALGGVGGAGAAVAPEMAAGGGLGGLMTGLFTNPWTAVVAAGILGGFAIWKKFSKSTAEKFALEFGRDFGNVKIGTNEVKGFLDQLGITEKQLKGIRKDVASSPMFLKIAYDAAKAQGKTAEFLKSLEKIETAWGTFNFRDAFEKGLNTGAWKDLNEEFVEAFGNSQALVDVFGNDLSPLFLEINEELEESIYNFEILDAALADLRAKPGEVADSLDVMVESLEHLQKAGATNDEIISILGEALVAIVDTAKELGVEIPKLVIDFYDLAAASTETADSISAVSDALSEGAQGWADFKKTGLEHATYVKDFVLAAWEDLGMANKSQAEQLKFQMWVWDEFGETFIDNANKIIKSPLGPEGLDWYTKLVLEWALSFNKVTKELDGTYKILDELSEVNTEEIAKSFDVFKDIDKSIKVPDFNRGVWDKMALDLVKATGMTGVGNITLFSNLEDAWEKFYRMGFGDIRRFKDYIFGPVSEALESGEFWRFSDAFRNVMEGASSGVLEAAIKTDLDKANLYAEQNPIVATVDIDLDASLTNAGIENFVRNRVIPEINRQLANRDILIP